MQNYTFSDIFIRKFIVQADDFFLLPLKNGGLYDILNKRDILIP